jgi:molybdenum cofactor cytidylyltransferase
LLSGLALGEQITPEALIRVLTHTQGGLKNFPSSARRVALLNQADALDDAQVLHLLAKGLLSEFRAVLVSALGADPPGVWEVYEPMAGIVLAAGAGERFGQTKQTLLWQGKPLVWHVCQAAINAGLDPVVVVTGAYSEEVASAVEGLPVTCVYNVMWEQGQSTSVKAGLCALPPQVGGAVFLLADQPRVPPTLIEELVRCHRQSLAPIVAPKVGQVRGNPVLFDRCTFAALLKLEGDVGGRMLFSRYPVTYLPWSDASVLLDVDTEADYRKLRGLDGKA